MKHWLIAGGVKQSGYGLLEVVVALALVAILGTGISIFTVQTLSQTDRSSYQMQAVQQLEIAGYWVSRDVQMARTVTPGPNAGFPLVVNWTDENNNTFQVTFSINGNQLQRSMVENGGPSRNTQLVYSINPSPTLTNCSYANSLLTFNATATFYSWSLSRTFLINKRPW
jgi:prepilin-type N-terminal cleavage/methylation domain-containing protein